MTAFRGGRGGAGAALVRVGGEDETLFLHSWERGSIHVTKRGGGVAGVTQWLGMVESREEHPHPLSCAALRLPRVKARFHEVSW